MEGHIVSQLSWRHIVTILNYLPENKPKSNVQFFIISLGFTLTYSVKDKLSSYTRDVAVFASDYSLTLVGAVEELDAHKLLEKLSDVQTGYDEALEDKLESFCEWEAFKREKAWWLIDAEWDTTKWVEIGNSILKILRLRQAQIR